MKGICFIEPLFHKVVKGEKTQTRRMIVSRTGHFQVSTNSMSGVITGIWQTDDNGWGGVNLIPVNPKYKVGEKVYLKEPYFIFDEKDNSCFYKYLPKVDWLTDKEFLNSVNSISRLKGWKNKLFMPESAARYFIEITAVRAERLKDISDEDCIKEGIFEVMGGALNMNSIDPIGYLQPSDAYAALIDKISGKGTWDNNPFVWVYDFKLVRK